MKLVKIRSRKYTEPHINWDFEASDDEYQARLDAILARGQDGIRGEQIINADESHNAEDVLEEIPAVIEPRELIVAEVLEGDELLETLQPEEGDEQVYYKVNRQVEVEPAKVKLRAEYTIEVVDISAELQEKAIMQAVAARRAFGDNLINKMSARNAVKPGWDVAKTLAYIDQTDLAVKLLQAGAIETALSAIGSVEASAELEQADIDFAIAQIQAFLG